jgi:hypothetical protein
LAVDLKAIEQLATDQASLKAAAGLAKPAKWSGIGMSRDGALLWGECAGSGANPYRVTADLRDLGNKCTCPSRKFPCKHVLGLLWLDAEAVLRFPQADTPDWVTEWLGRRRPGTAVPKTPGTNASSVAKPAAPKDVRAAGQQEPDAPDDPEGDAKAAARREAAAGKRAEETDRAIVDALDALEQWIGDQLRMGLPAFIDEATARCRRIAARLVDGKAAALAGRIDELPGRLLARPAGDRPRGAVVELGMLVLLARAWRATPRDPRIRRMIAQSETRETVLAAPDLLRVTAVWEVLAEQAQTRRDGLVSQTTWLLNLHAGGPRFAMLLDFFPATAGRRGPVFTPGERFQGELAFYPSQQPLRALLLQRTTAERADASDWPYPEQPLLQSLTQPLLTEPWTLDVPVLLPAGRIALDGAGHAWWRSADGETILPLAGETGGVQRGTDLMQAAALWSGGRLAILSAQTPWGRVGGIG